ncbi:TetR/AcrR family transcriptional regulator [Rhodoferax sp.]|uniref:TetR/AcrR family transcriptional regulator n=1 Tax=Rhodoferax sp. TaxID=50421 RepID=UPI0027465B95|nr:TetR/AcrR family transcriptional regulator [Rhodoferax sp.]
MTTQARLPAKTRYHHGDLRGALVDQAIATISEHGDLSFSLRDLASRVGVSHAAVYRHFSDKTALLNAVAVRGFALLAESIRTAGEGWDHDPAHQLARQGAAYVATAMHYPGHFAAMFAPQVSQSGQAVEVRTAAEAAYQPLVHSVMRRLKASDADDPSVQAEALRCWALMHGLACLQLSGNLSACLGRDVASASAAALQDLIASLLLPANHPGPTVAPTKGRPRAKGL